MIRTIAVVMVVGLVGCGSPLQQINTANEGARGLTKTVMPTVDAKCRALSLKCKADGVEHYEDCKATVECSAWRDRYYKVVNGIHGAAASAAVLTAIGKGDQLDQLAKKAMAALSKAYQMVKAAGYL